MNIDNFVLVQSQIERLLLLREILPQQAYLVDTIGCESFFFAVKSQSPLDLYPVSVSHILFNLVAMLRPMITH
jgi:hypothetical protein